jgi:hypothetical protein
MFPVVAVGVVNVGYSVFIAGVFLKIYQPLN